MIVKPNGNDIVGVVHKLIETKGIDVTSIVDVYGTSPVSDGQNWVKPAVLVDYKATTVIGQSNWCSINIANSNFTMSFRNNLIRITDYTLISRNFNPYDMPKNWVVKGSIDNKVWHYIDHRESEPSLKQGAATSTFHVKNPGTYSHFIFIQNGTNWNGRNFFTLGKVDLFGKIYDVENLYKYLINHSCRRKESFTGVFLVIYTFGTSY